MKFPNRNRADFRLSSTSKRTTISSNGGRLLQLHGGTWAHSPAACKRCTVVHRCRVLMALDWHWQNQISDDCIHVHDGAPKIAFSCLISGWILSFMVDITWYNYIVNGFINQQTSLGGHHRCGWGYPPKKVMNQYLSWYSPYRMPRNRNMWMGNARKKT